MSPYYNENTTPEIILLDSVKVSQYQIAINIEPLIYQRIFVSIDLIKILFDGAL